MRNLSIMAAALALSAVCSPPAAAQGRVEDMTSNCSFEAAKFFEGDVADIDIKYQGQRTDGTHAVNGRIFLETRSEDFQCSFAPDGIEMVEFYAEGRVQPGVGGSAGGGSGGGGVPAVPEDGGPRNWEVTGVSQGLNLREEPSTRARTIARYAPGTILDNLGCRRAEGRVWCDVQELGGGPRGYVAAEYLKPAVAPHGAVATGPDDSALRAGQGDFDATGQIPCAQHAGQPMTQCDFGVARAGGGYATVVVTRPDGRTRTIFFRMGRAIGADTSQADGYGEFRADRESDLNLIRVGDERYEIPDAVVLGG